ncbi:MAG: SDR family oxidoreductase [Burkholderiaceae bacterium]
MTAPLVFITGASSGIGQALAAHYAQQGWRLALAARRSDEMQAWASSLGLGEERCVAYGADVSRIDSIVAAGQACIARQGLPEVVVGNAGMSIGVDTADRRDLDALADTYATNNIGLAATFHPFVAPMRERRRGTLVGIASVAGIRGLPGHGAYAASKAAVISYCESLRVELRSSGVKVVTIAPGYIDTPLTRQNRYPMPFLMPADAFAQQAARAIGRGASYRVIPWQMGVVARVLRLLPDALFDRAFARAPRKHRRP